MSVSKQKKLTGHLPVLAFLFALPVLFVNGRSYFDQRSPASYKKPVNKNLYYEHKSDRKKKNTSKKISNLSGKPNGTFKTDVNVSVMNYRPEDKMAEMKVRLEFSPRIDTDIVNVSWKLPEGYSITEGDLSSTLQAMSAGETKSFSVTVLGNPAISPSSFVEVHSLISGNKLGAVQSLKLREALDDYLDAQNSGNISLKSKEKNIPKDPNVKIHF
ncbi:MAG: hypothetical protein VX642_12535 [Bdellovibrionota bacterium]|nr:hypothetical protein [Bdellovibrionota bacterium]